MYVRQPSYKDSELYYKHHSKLRQRIKGFSVLIMLAIIIMPAAILMSSCKPSDSVGGEDTSDWISSDYYIIFTQEPTVCKDVLTVKGHTNNGAIFGSAESSFLTFVIYHRSDSQPSYGLGIRDVDAILGFLEPLKPDEYYNSLDPTDRIATILKASSDDPAFELESKVPAYIADDPSDYILGIWGYRNPTSTYETLRTETLNSC